MRDGAVRDSMRRIVGVSVAAITLLVLAGTLLGGVEAAAHRHEGPGLYDASCPLAALAAVDRTSSIVPSPCSVGTVASSALVAIRPVLVAVLAPAADARLRAPPVR
jgi:hypothetical protein